MSIKLEREDYRRTVEAHTTEYGNHVPGQWEFLHKGRWHSVRNWGIRRELDRNELCVGGVKCKSHSSSGRIPASSRLASGKAGDAGSNPVWLG